MTGSWKEKKETRPPLLSESLADGFAFLGFGFCSATHPVLLLPRTAHTQLGPICLPAVLRAMSSGSAQRRPGDACVGDGDSAVHHPFSGWRISRGVILALCEQKRVWKAKRRQVCTGYDILPFHVILFHCSSCHDHGYTT